MTSKTANFDIGLSSLDVLAEQLTQFVCRNEVTTPDVTLSSSSLTPSSSSRACSCCHSTKDCEELMRSISNVRVLLSNIQDLVGNNQVSSIDCKNMDSFETENTDDGANDSLLQEKIIKELLQELNELKESNVPKSTRDRNVAVELAQTKQELNRCKETLQVMKSDRKRLKSEKRDLVSQMKQLYRTLEDKESELRDFIRNHEQRIKDVTDQMNQMAAEKEMLISEKCELARKSEGAEERCLSIMTELSRKNEQVSKLELQITRLFPRYDRTKTDGSNRVKSLGNNSSGGCSDDSTLKPFSLDGGHYSSSGDDLPPYQEIYLVDTENEPCLPRTASVSEGQLQASRQKAIERAILSRNSSGHLFRGNSRDRASYNKDKSVGSRSSTEVQRKNSFTRFSRTAAQQTNASNRCSIISPQNFHEKVQTASEARVLGISQWKANHVLAWLELDMEMTAYGEACAENIKSGKILLSLSDAELESALRLTSALHLRKLRLAIEELRDLATMQYPFASSIDSLWVSQNWIPALGLPQYSSSFEAQLIDGRLLNGITKKDLEKHLGVRKKFHQSSIEHGIEVLRTVDFDKQVLEERRSQCRENYSDPLVWSNQKVIQWAEHIDLHEYTRNLKNSGVHGGVLVMDRNFNSETLASVLNIPSSKSYVRRHLATEFDNIVQSARVELEASNALRKTAGPSFVRSFSSGGSKSDTEGTSGTVSGTRQSGSEKRHSFKFSRAFGRKSANNS